MFASKVDIDDDGKAIVEREIDGGIETLNLQFPAVISADLRLNTPRYPSLPNIIKAKRKPLKVVTIKDLDLEGLQNTIKYTLPEKRQAGVKAENILDFYNKIKDRGLI